MTEQPTAADRLAADMTALLNQYERETAARRALAGDPNPTDLDPFETVRAIADSWERTADDPDGRAALLDRLTDQLDTSEIRALRLAAEAAVAVTPRRIAAEVAANVSVPTLAADLGVTESYVYRKLREQRDQ
ncbi:hypothetical protein [Streptomyces sp. enrichment culture]|uniref:hypothetical protein n=1 Tax=Streptomyces sp. enrichment culture TaxID=1795815 RepID=UPI003F557E48